MGEDRTGPAGERPIVAAVRAGDAGEVWRLLGAGADPETLDRRGLPLLCLAVEAFAVEVADHLQREGAAPHRLLSDGTTPLLRAVESGSVGLTHTLLRDGEGRLPEQGREELLARAGQWYESGPVDGLRRRTGAPGPVGRTFVERREWFSSCEQFTLGGVSVRDGHAAVLTCLERAFGIRTPFQELLARALSRPDPDHVVWSESSGVLADRQDEETWAAAVALRAHPDPRHRRFAADVLFGLGLGDPASDEEQPFGRRALEFFLPWAAEETDPDVLVGVLKGLNDHDDPRAGAVALGYAEHPDPRIRCEALASVKLSGDSFRAEDWQVLVGAARDADVEVRQAVCGRLADGPSRAPGVTDLLAGLLADEDQLVRLWAVYGLAQRDDPRCLDGRVREEEFEREHWAYILDAPDRYRSRRRDGGLAVH